MVSSSRPRVGVVGCTGYIGIQCTALLAAHPGVELAVLAGRSAAGRRYGDVVPGSAVDMVVSDSLDPAAVDVVVAALPHTVAASQAQTWLDAGCVVVDLSADFRLRDAALYERWYGGPHPAPSLTGGAVYGLVEWTRAALRTARLIAVPGCYPTAGLLGTLPLLRDGVIEPRVIVDAKSGVSGAGRSPSMTVHFGEVNEGVRAYGVDGHRHSAEIGVELSAAAGVPVSLTFVPHLVPMTRGILATVYATPAAGRTTGDVVESLRTWCHGEPFLRWEDEPPSTKSVQHSNTAAISCTAQGEVAVVTVAIDNLVKGAAGQAVQALNVRLGLDECSGLTRTSPWP